MRQILTRKNVFIVLLTLTTVSVLLFVWRHTWFQGELVPFAEISSCVIAKNDTAYATCLRQKIDTLLQRASTKEIMGYLVASTSPGVVRGHCHEIAHVLGQETFARSSSLENALFQCTGQCRQGCTHGVIGAAVEKELGETYNDEDVAHASAQELAQIGGKYCANGASYCHAIGHLLYINTPNYKSAIDGCAAIGGGSREDCWRGVYMESAGSIDSLVFSTSTPHTDDYAYPCDHAPKEVAHACYEYLSMFQERSFFAAHIKDTPTRLKVMIQTCTALAEPNRSYCFEGLGFVGRSTFGGSMAETSSVCDSLATLSDRNACTLGMVHTLIDTDNAKRAVTYCANLSELPRKSFCEKALE